MYVKTRHGIIKYSQLAYNIYKLSRNRHFDPSIRLYARCKVNKNYGIHESVSSVRYIVRFYPFCLIAELLASLFWRKQFYPYLSVTLFVCLFV